MKRVRPARIASTFFAFALACCQVALAAFAPQARTPDMAQTMARGMRCHEADPLRVGLGVKKNRQDQAQQRDTPMLHAVALSAGTSLRVDFPRDEVPREREPPSPSPSLDRFTSAPPLILFAHRRE